MPDNSFLKHSFRIANVTVNPQLNTIRQNQDTIRVEPKVMKLLCFLVSNEGKVCSKQDILDEIWPRQIVADDAVTRLIFVLRNALADDAKSPTFISTVPKKGYVFLVTATPLRYRKVNLWAIISTCFIVIVLISYWLYSSPLVNKSSYEILRALPVTYQEGREYDYTEKDEIKGYFHQHNNLTSLVVTQGETSPMVLSEDDWQKRSLLITDNVVFYIRYTTSQFQIVQQDLDGTIEVLVNSKAPIYSLSLDDKTQSLLFNQFHNNENTRLYSYSFMSGQISPLAFANTSPANKVYSHFYQSSQDTLFFVGVEGRKPTIFGMKRKASSYQYQVEGFERIRYITEGKTPHELLVVGTYQFTQGIWSVSLDDNEVSLITSHPDNNITQVYYSAVANTLYYSFHGQRVDLEEVSFNSKSNSLQQLNSTLVDSTASYSADGTTIYFASDRSGDFELYSYRIASSMLQKVSQLNATRIWHYSISNDHEKVAIVYSTDHIRLAVIALASGTIINSVPLEELKFPLNWSKDDKQIYISEHRSNIAMYLYDAEQLTIEKKRPHLGLTAVELNHREVLAFDYQTKRFVTYNFNTEQIEAMSVPLQNYAAFAPHNTYSDGKQVMILHSDGMKKIVHRIVLSKDPKEQQKHLVANLLKPGIMQAFSPDMSSILLANREKSLSGNIVALQLK